MKKILAVVLALTMMLTVSAMAAADGEESFTVGICQLAPHPALDAATQGFKDALTEEFGENVKFDEQNAGGEDANCATIIDGFVANDVDLILANATASAAAGRRRHRHHPRAGHLRYRLCLRPGDRGLDWHRGQQYLRHLRPGSP